MTVVEEAAPTAEGYVNPYVDVAASDWFYDAVRFVSERGLMTGTGADRFSPGTATTRAMLVTTLHRLAGAPAAAAEGLPFPDVESGQWYTDAVRWAAENGVVEGYDDGLFRPHDFVTREQIVTILYRYDRRGGAGTDAQADLSPYADADRISDWARPAAQWAVAREILQGRDGTTLAPRDRATRAEVAAILQRYLADSPGTDTSEGA
ncbi:MAG: S-layer homology domain-containing protein [Oscillospiraceae bacterium]|nr:S-layer homology domain-containing protein [Oscillospiraceae bacterium]